MANNPQQTPRQIRHSNWLQRRLQSRHAYKEGDTVAAQIGENARNIAVGTKIIQIIGNTLNIPPYLAIMIAIGIAGGVVMILLVLVKPSDMHKIVTVPLELRMPDESFNIAVAPFQSLNSAGKPITSTLGYERASSIARFFAVESNTEAIGEILDQGVVIWGPAKPISTVTSVEAQARATALNADILIYGDLRQSPKSNDQWQLIPKFYISDSAVRLAQEYVGEWALGTPLDYKPGTAGDGDVNLEMDLRVKALSQVLRGLSYIEQGNQEGYRKAVAMFQETAEHSEWAQSSVYSGQDILYLFLGNAYLLQAQLTGDALPERSELLIRSRDAFSQAIDLSSDNPRPFNGLGSVYFQMARALQGHGECEWQWPLLEQAAEMHTHALNATAAKKPLSGWVDYRAHSGLGRIYYWEGYCSDDDALHNLKWTDAQQYYQQVVAEYATIDDPHAFLTDIAAIAYTDLGLMALVQGYEKLANQDPKQHDAGQKLLAQSIDHYQYAFELIAQSHREESLTHGKAALPYYLTALCLDSRTAAARTALDNFVALLSDPEAARTAIVGSVLENIRKGCSLEEP
jgi:hypothetical protein